MSELKDKDGSAEEMDEIFDLQALMTSVAPFDSEGQIAATANSFTDDQARDVASRILSVYIDILRSKSS